MTAAEPQIHWTDDQGHAHHARWWSLAGQAAPAVVQLADEHLGVDQAHRLMGQGVGLLWLGHYQAARQLLQALGQRLAGAQGRAPTPGAPGRGADLGAVYRRQRQQQAVRARRLGLLLLPFDADHGVPLPGAPDLRAAGREARGAADTHYVASLRELLGLVGAHEWRKKGVPVPALGAAIHPHHGVFSPIRGEYIALVAKTPLPPAAKPAGAADIGTGTGVLAAVLARRGLRVAATDLLPAALACAADNLQRLGLGAAVSLERADLYPAAAGGRFGLVVCNPPWVPGPATSALDAAVFDPDSRMLRGFLDGLAAHLVPDGEGWLILSDLAEHLGLRPRATLLGWVAAAGLQVLGRVDARPRHGRAADRSDPLHAARSAEVTSLWRLGPGAAHRPRVP